MKLLIGAISALGFAATAAVAQVGLLTSYAGFQYTESVNGSGTVLTSTYPKAFFIGEGVNMDLVVQVEKIYLGKDCDAYHDIYGKGVWSWANGGVMVEFPAETFVFPKQELREYYEKCNQWNR